MKYITFAVPCYNSEEYMNKCIDSLLIAGDEAEIIIVNDGSSDNTKKIAENYQKKYPNIVRVINKENGGHGSGVNTGLEHAKGLYFKVVDSDDWVDEKSLKLVLKTIKKLEKQNKLVDMMVVNYVYEKNGKTKEINYKKTLPEDKVFNWEEVGKFRMDSYLLMHSVIYNTKFLKSTNLVLPEHTFYVDNIFVYYPLPKIKTMYYLNIPFYRYYIGRDDQSVNEKIMISRIDQQIYVTKTMIKFFNPYDYWDNNRNCSMYLIHYLDIMMTVTTSLLQVEGTKDAKYKIKDLWQFLKQENPHLYDVCKMSLSGLVCMPRFITVPIYRLTKKIYKFN